MNSGAAPAEARAAIRTPLSEADADTLARAMVRALQQARSVSDSEHFDHHRWIVLKMKTERRRAEFWEKMFEHLVKVGAASVLSAAIYALYLGVKVLLQRGG